MSTNIIGKYWRDRENYGFFLIDLDKVPDKVKNDLETIFKSNIKKNKSYINSIFIDKRTSKINLELGKYYSINLKNVNYYGYSGWVAIEPKIYEYSNQFPDYIPLNFDSNDNFRYFYFDKTGDRSNLHSISTKLNSSNISERSVKSTSKKRHRSRSRSPVNEDNHKSKRSRHRSQSPNYSDKRYKSRSSTKDRYNSNSSRNYRYRSRSPVKKDYSERNIRNHRYRSPSPTMKNDKYIRKKDYDSRDSHLSYENFKLFSEFFKFYQNT